MKKSIKKWCAVLLSAAMIFALTSCGRDKTSADNASTTESTTTTTTSTTTTTTTTTTSTTTTTTTEAESTENTQKPTTKPTITKPTTTKPTTTKPTTTKPTTTKPTTTKPQKATPKFVFSQKLPVKVTAFGAEFEVVKASTQNGYWYDEENYLFDISITMKRCDDGINEEKVATVQMTIKDSNGKVVRRTSTSAGMLNIGEQGTGSMAWSVDAPGTYTIEFSSI